MIQAEKYARKPFIVDAVQVTADNLAEVAHWVQGDVRTERDENNQPAQYVHVRVHRALNERQTKAFVGDWVLYAGTGYKVYTEKAFKSTFEPATGEVVDAAAQAEKMQPAADLLPPPPYVV